MTLLHYARCIFRNQRQFQFPYRRPTSRNHKKNCLFSSQAIVEIQQVELYPRGMGEYIVATGDTMQLRKHLSPLRLFTLPVTGGKLNVSTQFYYYSGGMAERDAIRQEMAQNEAWQLHVNDVLRHVQSQHSTLYVQAPFLSNNNQSQLATIPDKTQQQQNQQQFEGGSSKTIFEIRKYNLKLGYDTVPKFLELYEGGLPSKLNAPGNDPTTSLITLLYSEVGRLNEVIEVWKHGDGTLAMERSRIAARSAPEWRNAIANIADLAIEFTSTIHKPATFSPMK